MTTGVNTTWRGRYKQNTSATWVVFSSYTTKWPWNHNVSPWLYVFKKKQPIIALFLDVYRDLDIEVIFVDLGLSLNTSFVMSIKSQKTLCKWRSPEINASAKKQLNPRKHIHTRLCTVNNIHVHHNFLLLFSQQCIPVSLLQDYKAGTQLKYCTSSNFEFSSQTIRCSLDLAPPSTLRLVQCSICINVYSVMYQLRHLTATTARLTSSVRHPYWRQWIMMEEMIKGWVPNATLVFFSTVVPHSLNLINKYSFFDSEINYWRL